MSQHAVPTTVGNYELSQDKTSHAPKTLPNMEPRVGAVTSSKAFCAAHAGGDDRAPRGDRKVGVPCWATLHWGPQLYLPVPLLPGHAACPSLPLRCSFPSSHGERVCHGHYKWTLEEQDKTEIQGHHPRWRLYGKVNLVSYFTSKITYV